MQHIRNWSAKRSGARITISGVDDKQAPVRIAAVDRIDATASGIMAIKVDRTVAVLVAPGA